MPDGSSGLSKPLVLVVEDEAPLATMLRYNLEKQGFRVEEAVDGEEALTRIEEVKPDLVLLDWMLPVMSGIEVCRQIRRRSATRDLPVHLLTHRKVSSDLIELPEEGIDLEKHLEGIRIQLMQQALDRTGGVQTQAAELLGMSFRSFRYYAKKAGLKGGD